jgi:hypothetical protein
MDQSRHIMGLVTGVGRGYSQMRPSALACREMTWPAESS